MGACAAASSREAMVIDEVRRLDDAFQHAAQRFMSIGLPLSAHARHWKQASLVREMPNLVLVPREATPQTRPSSAVLAFWAMRAENGDKGWPVSFWWSVGESRTVPSIDGWTDMKYLGRVEPIVDQSLEYGGPGGA